MPWVVPWKPLRQPPRHAMHSNLTACQGNPHGTPVSTTPRLGLGFQGMSWKCVEGSAVCRGRCLGRFCRRWCHGHATACREKRTNNAHASLFAAIVSDDGTTGTTTRLLLVHTVSSRLSALPLQAAPIPHLTHGFAWHFICFCTPATKRTAHGLPTSSISPMAWRGVLSASTLLQLSANPHGSPTALRSDEHGR